MITRAKKKRTSQDIKLLKIKINHRYLSRWHKYYIKNENIEIDGLFYDIKKDYVLRKGDYNRYDLMRDSDWIWEYKLINDETRKLIGTS